MGFSQPPMRSLARGVSRWLYGLILDKYTAVSGPWGKLGFLSTGIIVKGSTRKATFVHGSIARSRTIGHCSVNYS